jgi:NAD(P)-dependent dehydrogenase (short-subunit alcohol dehydrogenase family)
MDSIYGTLAVPASSGTAVPRWPQALEAEPQRWAGARRCRTIPHQCQSDVGRIGENDRTLRDAIDRLEPLPIVRGEDDAAVWLVTGAAYGLGRLLAETALRRGRRVAVTASRLEKLWFLVDEYGSAVLPIELDVNDELADRDVVERVVGAFGRVDVVVNNAGFDSNRLDRASESPLERAQTNLFGALWISQSALAYMHKAVGGQIFLVFGLTKSDADLDSSVFFRAKRALEGFCEHLARDVAPLDVTVTVCLPTELHDGSVAANNGRGCAISHSR